MLQLRCLGVALLVAVATAFTVLHPTSIFQRLASYAQFRREVELRMVALDNPPISVKLKVTNAFDSPNVVLYRKGKDRIDPFQSPAIQTNGVKSAETVDPTKSPSVIMLNRKGTETFNALTSPSVTFLGVDATKARNAMSSPALQTTSEAKTKQDLPLNLVVGQETIKSALILLAVNPKIGGIVIAGGRGMAKSVMARALHRVMPPIEVIKGSEYNIDPKTTNSRDIDDFLLKELKTTGTTLEGRETAIIPCPFVQVPVNVMEDRLFGSVDVKKTLERGETVFTPGLLASAHRGILYVDDIQLLDTELVTLLLQAVTDGQVIVEREGISVRYPCQPLLIATTSSEEGEGLKDVFLDRIGVALSADREILSMEQRVEAVNTVLQFNDKTLPSDILQSAYDAEAALQNAIIFAREYLRDVQLSPAQMLYLCEEATRGGLQGHRGEITASRVAIAAAALDSSSVVRADDLRLAVKLALIPRSIFREQMQQQEDELMPPPPPPPAPASQQQPEQPETSADNDDKEDKEEDKEDDKENEEDDDDEEEEAGEPTIPEEFMFDAVNVAMEDDMMKFGGRQKAGKGGKSGLLLSRDRGRYIRPVMPKEGEPTRIAVDATLREAAKNQLARRKAAVDAKDSVLMARKILLEPSDLRAKLMARKAGSLLIFAVDASGSMALNRMNAAKGAACALLQEAYQSRDKIALIPFQGSKAEVLLPPTRSISLAKNRLDMMPCGGGSPLAHALMQAVRTGVNAMSSGDTGRCVIVLISDGRANVPLDVSLDAEAGRVSNNVDGANTAAVKLSDAEKKEQRQKLKDEVLGVARQIADLSAFKLLVIDTENKFVSTGMAKEIAQAANGKYHFIPKASADAMKQVTVEAVQSLKRQQSAKK